jgi:hypothetical protein
MSLSNTAVAARVAITARNTIDLGASSAHRALALAQELANGTGAGQADLAFADTRTLAASATEDLDLAGALADAFGVSQVFARVKVLMVQAAPGNTNNVLVSRPAANGLASLFSAAGDQVILRPGATLLVAAGIADAIGYAVTAATADLLTITNSGAGTSVTYSIAAVGCSA